MAWAVDEVDTSSPVRMENPPPRDQHVESDEPINSGRFSALMDRPGEWGIVARAKLMRLPYGDWEYVIRTVGDDVRLYARYLGPGY